MFTPASRPSGVGSARGRRQHELEGVAGDTTAAPSDGGLGGAVEREGGRPRLHRDRPGGDRREVEAELTERVARAAAAAADPLDALRRGCHEFLDAATDEAVQRIVLLDAPAVLGWHEWRELEARYGLGLTTAGLEAAMQAGVIERQPVEPLAHMLLAALCEAALLVAGAPDPTRARAEVGVVVDHLLDRLATRPATRPARRSITSATPS